MKLKLINITLSKTIFCPFMGNVNTNNSLHNGGEVESTASTKTDHYNLHRGEIKTAATLILCLNQLYQIVIVYPNNFFPFKKEQGLEATYRPAAAASTWTYNKASTQQQQALLTC